MEAGKSRKYYVITRKGTLALKQIRAKVGELSARGDAGLNPRGRIHSPATRIRVPAASHRPPNDVDRNEFAPLRVTPQRGAPWGVRASEKQKSSDRPCAINAGLAAWII